MNTLVTRARRHLAAVAALALAGSLASCAALSPGSDSSAAASGAAPTPAPSGALTVFTSFYPIQYLAQAIGGEHVAVTSVTPTNENGDGVQTDLDDSDKTARLLLHIEYIEHARIAAIFCHDLQFDFARRGKREFGTGNKCADDNQQAQ